MIEGDILEGRIEFSRNGSAILISGEKEIFIYKKNTSNSLHMDNVCVEVIKVKNKLEGRVIKVLSRFKTNYVGSIHINGKTTFVIPDSNKIFVDFYIKKNKLPLKDGEKVLVELIKWDKKSPIGRIVKILGKAGENNVEMNSIMSEYGLPMDFSKEVIEESEKISDGFNDEEISKRLDMRKITTFTIDPDNAKDFDDALSVQIYNDYIEVGVHIADVSQYVKPETKLDEEAYKRATSVYLVDRCVPMLPERLSNDLCSLKPNVDRYAFSVIFNIDYKTGKVLDEWYGKTIIHSDKRYTYEEAQEIIEGKDDKFSEEINVLNNLAKKLRAKRFDNGSIEITSKEVKFVLDENKKPTGVSFKEQKDSNKLIEEFMLLANKHVAKKISDSKYTNVYRTHNTPNIDKLNSLKEICDSFGYKVNVLAEGDELKASLNKLLMEVKDQPEENMISTLVTRSMSKATYTISNIGHYGLGFEYYSHFTSPIRRYPDLMVHRILFDILNKKHQGNPTKIEEQSKWCSSREIAASKAERDSIRYKQAEFLLDKIGQEFEGIITSITDWGMYVELLDNKCEGMISYKRLEGFYAVDTKAYVVIHNYQTSRLGDTVTVIVKSVDLEKKQIDFLLKI